MRAERKQNGLGWNWEREQLLVRVWEEERKQEPQWGAELQQLHPGAGSRAACPGARLRFFNGCDSEGYEYMV